MVLTEFFFKWIQEWLNKRKQRVVLNGNESRWTEVTSSVVQGSVLGPICFTIYMNDIDKGVSSVLSKFADDTKVVCPIRTKEDHTILQNYINTLLTWAKDWQISFNKSKCSVLHFGQGNPNYTYYMEDIQINKSKEEKDLGVYISTNMKFSKQCAETTKKANKIIGMIKRNFNNFDKKVIMQLYKSLSKTTHCLLCSSMETLPSKGY